jgi:hypothetical protein
MTSYIGSEQDSDEALGFTMQVVAPEYASDGSVDINKQPALKRSTGKWRACYLILGTQAASSNSCTKNRSSLFLSFV